MLEQNKQLTLAHALIVSSHIEKDTDLGFTQILISQHFYFQNWFRLSGLWTEGDDNKLVKQLQGRKASDERQAVPRGGGSSGRALQGSALGLVLFNIFITNLKGEGRLHKIEPCRWLFITQELQAPSKRRRELGDSFGKVVGKETKKLEARKQ